MQLKELIEKEGIENVVNKTTISQGNLNYMMDEDFSKLSRVKALGFLVILEREYKELDVSEYRERVKLFFEKNHPDHDNVIILQKTSSPDSKGGISFFKWFVILGIIFGGWYLYQQGSLDSLLQNIISKKDVYSDDKALENNISMEEAEKVSVREDTHEPVSIVAPIEPKINLSTAANVEQNNTEVSVVETISINNESAQSSTTAELNKINTTQPLMTEVEKSVSDTNNSEELVSTGGISTITINPTRGMLWFGFINVDTKKKKEFMKQVSTPFDINDGRWILVTGHGFVDIVSELQTVEVSDRNKHYFYVDSNELKEISQKEFRELNGGHGWI